MNGPHLSDRMPEVARGEAAWTALEAAHLESCSACDGEWHLIRLAAKAVTAPEPLDLDRIAAGVVAATIEPAVAVIPISSRGRNWLRYSVAGLAAAAALAIVLRLTIPSGQESASEVDQIAIGILPELDQLNPAELDGVLAEFRDEENWDRPLGEIPRLGELTDGELSELLSEVGG